MEPIDQEREHWEAEAQGWADTTSEADLRSKSVGRLVPEQDETDNGPQGKERYEPSPCEPCPWPGYRTCCREWGQ